MAATWRRTALIPLVFSVTISTLGFQPVFKATLSLGRGTATPNPFSGRKLYADPASAARRQANAWRHRRPDDAQLIDRIARQPQAYWITDWSGDPHRVVQTLVDRVTRAGALPLLVAYNIPQRDCGSYSAGGARSAEAYRTWIRAFAAGLSRPSVVILEPDALGLICSSEELLAVRAALLRDAVQVLGNQGAAVYLDAGHPYWIAHEVMAARLKLAGIEDATGFALNTANFHTTRDNIAYGEAISRLVGGKHFVIDTSRNGNGSDRGNWCNARGRHWARVRLRRPTTLWSTRFCGSKGPANRTDRATALPERDSGGPPTRSIWPGARRASSLRATEPGIQVSN